MTSNQSRVVHVVYGFCLDVTYLVGLLIALLVTSYSKKHRQNFLFALTRNFWGRKTPDLDSRPVIWVHAVSVGEGLLSSQLIQRMQAIRHDLQWILSVSTGDAMTAVNREFPNQKVFYAPFDFSWANRAVMQRLKPQAVMIAENDFWTNMLNEIRFQRIPLAIFNTRMSPREISEHKWDAVFLRNGLKTAQWWSCVSKADSKWIQHFFQIPSNRITVTGSLKSDGIVRSGKNPDTQRLRERFQIQDEDLVLVAGSTHEPEEAILLQSYLELVRHYPQLRLIIAPRKVDRCPSLIKCLTKLPIRYTLNSELPAGLTQRAQVILIDSIGILRHAWGLADFAFIGGSIPDLGGHNMLEPASYGVPICFGPHIWNFQSTAEHLVETSSAVIVRDQSELTALISDWILDREKAAAVGKNAQNHVRAGQSIQELTIQGLLSILPRLTTATPIKPAVVAPSDQSRAKLSGAS